MGLSSEEQGYFTDLVTAESGPTAAARTAAEDRLKAAQEKARGDELTADQFALVSRWWHFAMLELFKTRDFKPSATWIAGRLGIAKDDARAALSRLVRLGFLKKANAKLSLSKPKTRTQSGVPSAAIRSYQHELIARAGQALEMQGFDERDTSSVVLAVSSDRLAEAREKIAAFRRDFAAEFAVQKNASSVYCLAVQYFRLDKE